MTARGRPFLAAEILQEKKERDRQPILAPIKATGRADSQPALQSEDLPAGPGMRTHPDSVPVAGTPPQTKLGWLHPRSSDHNPNQTAVRERAADLESV